MTAKFHCFNDTEEMFDGVAEEVTRQLQRALEKQGIASLILPGGTTPAPLFERLSKTSLNWENVTCLPSDERWVDEDHEQSNYRLIKANLLKEQAADATLCSLKTEEPSPKEAVNTLNERLDDIIKYSACTVLGMGKDGHFASLFPEAANLEEGLSFSPTEHCIAIDATGSPVAGDYPHRMSLTLSALLKSQLVIIMITGQDKRKVIEEAMSDRTSDYPITALLSQSQTPVEIYWTDV